MVEEDSHKFPNFVQITNFSMGSNDPWSYLLSLRVQHRTWDDPLFSEGLSVCCPLRKVPCVDLDEEDFLHDRVEAITCNVVGCNKSFTTVAESASHQRACHSNMCVVCKQSFATNHLLDLHVLESHDTLFHIMAEGKPMYQCLLETCRERTSDPAERKNHCVSKHSFPTDFRFDSAWRKMGKNRRGRGKQQKEEESSAMECEVEAPAGSPDMTVPESTAACGSDHTNIDFNARKKNTHKIPDSISFGAGVPRGFNRRTRGRKGDPVHWHQRMRPSCSVRTKIEEVNMKELEQALVTEPAAP